MTLNKAQTKNVSNIMLTDNAAKKIFSLIEEEGNFNLKLRIFISGGGCSGFEYNFTFDEEEQEDDHVIEKPLANGNIVFLLVDAMSHPYLDGSTIDYQEDIGGSQFVIKNPNAKGTCGCGNSFDV